jgi:hypothetical protein
MHVSHCKALQTPQTSQDNQQGKQEIIRTVTKECCMKSSPSMLMLRQGP